MNDEASNVNATSSEAGAASGSGLSPLLDVPDPDAFAAMMAEYDRMIQHAISSQQALNEKIDSLNREIEVKNRILARQERLVALGEMAAGVAHEIRNPLGGISLYLELLTQDVASIEGAPELCGKIKNAVGRLNHIVEQILNFTRQLEPSVEKVEARSFFDDLLGILQPDAEEAEVKVEIEYRDEFSHFEADPKLLHQVFLNLLRNAIEASPSASQVVVCCDRDDTAEQGTSVFRVLDRGQGLNPDVLEKLFTPFFTTKSTGTGLGLALSQKILEAHSGSLTASNIEGSGACFELRLPHANETRRNQ